MTNHTLSLVKQIAEKCAQDKTMLVIAESCSGGMISAALTDLSGSSAYFERGFVTYTNEAKIDILGVSADTLKTHGAVSAETAIEMAIGALYVSRAHFSLSVTGIAGPTGGSKEKPVGLVHFGLARRNHNKFNIILEDEDFEYTSTQQFFTGDRASIRAQTRDFGLQLLLEKL